jgi:tetratricopeptide (TPR) repeat protein
MAPGVDPARRRELRGDLDNIVLKAIAPEPARRYASAESLAEDVERYLNRRPVQARAGNWGYRAERFVARHRLAVALSALLALTVVAAAVGLTVQSRQARLEAERSRRLAGFLTHVMGLGFDRESGPFRAEGASARVIDVVRYAADRLPAEMADQPELEAQMRANIGHALAALGDMAGAEVNLRRGLALVDARRNPALAAELTGHMARTSELESDDESAARQYKEALRLLDAARGRVTPAVESVLVLNAWNPSLPPAESDALLERGSRCAREVGEASPIYAQVLFDRGLVSWVRGHPEESVPRFRQALAILDAIRPRPIEECELRQVWGQMEMARGNLQAAEPLMAESLHCLERALLPGEGHLMWAELSRLKLLIKQGHFKEAAGPLDALVAEIPRLRPKDRELLANALKWRAKALCQGAAACGN